MAAILVIKWGVGTDWKLDRIITAACCGAVNVPMTYISGAQPREALAKHKIFLLAVLAFVGMTLYLDFTSMFGRQAKAPFQSRTAFTILTFVSFLDQLRGSSLPVPFLPELLAITSHGIPHWPHTCKKEFLPCGTKPQGENAPKVAVAFDDAPVA